MKICTNVVSGHINYYKGVPNSAIYNITLTANMYILVGSSLYITMCHFPNRGGYLRGVTNHKIERLH